MLEWMILPLKRYADFSGRSRRREYWLFFLFNLIVSAVLLGPIYAAVISNAMSVAAAGGDLQSYETAAMAGFQFGDHPIASLLAVLGGLWALFTIIPNIAVNVRRLHDRDMSGWWYLGFIVCAAIPVVGLVVAIAYIVLMCLEGTKGPNRFGADPKSDARASDVFS